MNRAHGLQHPMEFGPSNGNVQQELVRLGTQELSAATASPLLDLLQEPLNRLTGIDLLGPSEHGKRFRILALGRQQLAQLEICIGLRSIDRHRTLKVEDRLRIIGCSNRMTP